MVRERFGGAAGRAKAKATREANTARRQAERASGMFDPDANGPDGAPADRSASGARRPASSTLLRREIASLLMIANAPLYVVAPSDMLNQREIDELAKALAEDTYTGPRLAKVSGGASHLPLLIACITLAVPRLSRHGLIPAGLFDSDQNAGARDFAAGLDHLPTRPDAGGAWDGGNVAQPWGNATDEQPAAAAAVPLEAR